MLKMSADAEDADHLPPPPSNPNGKRNAFSELMSANRKQPAPRHPQTPMTRNPNPNGPRSGLLAYITDPAAHSEMRVINYDSSFVLINDLFPKATTHLLLLPRDPSKYLLHPHDAFADPVFLASVKSAAATAARLAAKELERLLLPFSASSQPRLKALESAEPPDALPEGREWSAEIRVGIHAHPSMSHLHIHILSRDMHSECLKHRKHYNSFNTDFFIPLADYPLAEDDVRRDVGYQNRNLKRDFKCWRCGTEFGNRFTELKGHLEREFDEWKRE